MRSTFNSISVRLAAIAVAGAAIVAPAAAEVPKCGPDALGVARTVEIDTTGGPGFGFEHYKAHDFLQMKEVIFTFDDGPLPSHTRTILKALAEHCTRATFFPVGKLAVGYPEVLREVAAGGHTIGAHTFSHIDLGKAAPDKAKDEIERGFSAVHRGAGTGTAPFFRYPFLRDSKDSLAHLGGRNIAIFSTDIDSFDFKVQNPDNIVKTVMAKLDKRGKGMILMHDIQPSTAKALPMLLKELKAKGYKVVHMRPKDNVKTLAEFDALIEKDVKGLPAAGLEKPTSSVVKTVPSN
jgi:peptidoglycan/xylan/chitin deacetylase (PgdA/CDA1 family)